MPLHRRATYRYHELDLTMGMMCLYMDNDAFPLMARAIELPLSPEEAARFSRAAGDAIATGQCTREYIALLISLRAIH